MGKGRGRLKQIKALQKSAKRFAQVSPQEQLKELIEEEQYLSALDLLKRINKSQPELRLTPSEGKVRLLLGQQEQEAGQYKTAAAHLRAALELATATEDYRGDAYYFSAKNLVLQDRCAEALHLIQTAFEQEKLPKSHAGCYLKLLLIQGETETVKTLVAEQPKRFYAAQLHWVRGILALETEQPQEALVHFRKSKDPTTPGDTPKAWPLYALQCQEDWSKAAESLHQLKNALSSQQENRQNPWVEWLELNQRIHTGRLARTAYERRTGQGNTAMRMALELLALLEVGDVHEAGHTFLQLASKDADFPELKALHRPLMMVAGDQSIVDQDYDCAEEFWEEVAAEKPLNFQLNLNLLCVQRQVGSSRAGLSTVSRLMQWLERDVEAQQWSQSRRQQLRLRLHCFAADFQVKLSGRAAALKEVKQAAKLNPHHPEVLARLGLVAYMDHEFKQAIALLTEALEKGSEIIDVYESLLDCFDQIGDQSGKGEARQRFGKAFGDVVEAAEEMELPRWMEALATQTYLIFESLIHPEDPEGPEEVACSFFVDAVDGEPNKGGRVDVDLKDAEEEWNELLGMCNAQEQVTTLQAIALCLQLFCKRIKGREGLIKQYQEQLLALESEVPEALPVYLALLSLKNTATATQQMRPHLTRYLKRSPEPGTTLAQVQLKARWFGQSEALLPFIDEALKKEPQNPQLLLAKATVYPLNHPQYRQYREQGFDIARRLQDAAALQAFREEQAFESHWHTKEAMPTNLANFDPMDPSVLDKVVEQMIRSALGSQASEQEIRALLPLFKQKMMEEMEMSFGFGGGAFEGEGGFPIPMNLFGPPGGGRARGKSNRKSAKSKKRRR